MNHLQQDTQDEINLLEAVLQCAKEHLQQGDHTTTRMTAPSLPPRSIAPLPTGGLGASKTLDLFKQDFAPYLLNSSGSRYFGFVIGGVTPAALAGDWLTALYDQNAFGFTENVDRHIENEAVDMLRQLVNLPSDYFGALCSGATMANFVGLATARQWYAQQLGINPEQDGLFGLSGMNLVSGCAHGSTYKVLSMLGIGKSSLHKLPCLPGREAVDIPALEAYLKSKKGQPVIVIANLGTANSGDYDDIPAIAALKDKYNFYLHVDAAIIGIAAASPKYAHIFAGLEAANSLTIDAHKWLNTPYDGAVQLTKHKDLQLQVFAQTDAYPKTATDTMPLFNFLPEGSRRFRALSLWFSLMAYGKEGYVQIVEENCAMAQRMAQHIQASPHFTLLNQARLNIACYTLNHKNLTPQLVDQYLAALRAAGVTYSNGTDYFGTPAVRVCVSNYRTNTQDIDAAFASMQACAQQLLQGGE